MFQHLVSIYRRLFSILRTHRPARRWVSLNVLALEARVTPAVVDGFTVPIALPDIVQVAPSREANVRADLFGVGGEQAMIQVEDEAESLTGLAHPSAEVFVWFSEVPTKEAEEPQTEPDDAVLFVEGDAVAVISIEEPMLLPIN
jgi:hypothetical protein